MTFTLSSMVALDNALWMLYAQENGYKNFDEMIPSEFRQALGNHHQISCPHSSNGLCDSS